MRYFAIEEFQCPCCGEAPMDKAFLRKLDNARDFAEMPFVINSGYRCAQHNPDVGGSPSSSHLRGVAADIGCDSSVKRFRMLEALRRAGFRRIGIGSNFIHVDSDGEKAQEVMWVYE